MNGTDLIRREDAIAAFIHLSQGAMEGVIYKRTINAIPAVDAVEVKHGEWEKRMNIGVLTWCSECGWMKHQEDERKYNYCPNCGARMDGGNDAID